MLIRQFAIEFVISFLYTKRKKEGKVCGKKENSNHNFDSICNNFDRSSLFRRNKTDCNK